MKGYSIHILPALNRDGMGLNQPGNCESKAGSLNQAGVDLANDFGSFESAQPETLRIKRFIFLSLFFFEELLYIDISFLTDRIFSYKALPSIIPAF
jgi:hypothetical protein